MANFAYNLYDNNDFNHIDLNSFVYRLLLDIITTAPIPSELVNSVVVESYASLDLPNTDSDNSANKAGNLIAYRMDEFNQQSITNKDKKNGSPTWSIVYEFSLKKLSDGQNNAILELDLMKLVDTLVKSITQNEFTFQTTINGNVYESYLSSPSNYRVSHPLDGEYVRDLNDTGNLRTAFALLITITKTN